MRSLLLFFLLSTVLPAVTWEGESGPGKGKHIVFIASDHEYRSEETMPALARILAVHYGFKCTVLFGVDEAGHIKPGHSNIPGLEALESADLMAIFTRFQNLPPEQMDHIVAYLDRAGPVFGLRTATHAFKIPGDSPYAKFDFQFKGENYLQGFGEQVLGETWVGHYGSNHKQATRIDPLKVEHPILRGVGVGLAKCGGYAADPPGDATVLAMAQPLMSMEIDGTNDPKKPPVPAAWVRAYTGKKGKTGRVFTSTYGASDDLLSPDYRRLLVNALLWAVGSEDAIAADGKIDFVGPYQPTWVNRKGPARNVKPEDIQALDSPILPAANPPAAKAPAAPRRTCEGRRQPGLEDQAGSLSGRARPLPSGSNCRAPTVP